MLYYNAATIPGEAGYIIEQEPRTVIHVKRAKRFDHMC